MRTKILALLAALAITSTAVAQTATRGSTVPLGYKLGVVASVANGWLSAGDIVSVVVGHDYGAARNIDGDAGYSTAFFSGGGLF